MATSGSNSSDICSICTEKFKNPKLLACFHTFCLKCLQQFVSSSSKDGQFLCPLCRHPVKIPEKGVAGFQTNFYIVARGEKQLHGTGECCEMCEQRARASHTCRECEMLMCDPCVNVHNNIPSTRSHMVINLTDSDSSKPVLSVQQFCKKHVNEQLRFYCKPCSKMICRDCKLTDHDGHKTKDISDFAAEARTSLMKTKVKLEKNNTEICKTLEKVTDSKTEMLEKVKTTKKDVNDIFDSLEEIIHTLRSREINQLTVIEELYAIKYSDKRNTLTQRKRFLQSHIDHSDTMLREGLNCDVITADAKMKQTLAKVEKEQSIDSNSVPQFVYTPPKQHAAISLNIVVRDSIKKLFINSFPLWNKNVSVKIVRTIHHDFYAVNCLSFTKSKHLLCVQSCGYTVLRLYETSSTQPKELFSSTMDQLKKHGVHGLIQKHKKEKPEKKIPENDYTDLKKPFPYMETNDDGDTCSVGHENDRVIIKPVNGGVRTLTFNPFAEAGQPFKPVDVCWGKNKDVYIADCGGNVITVYSLEEGFQKSFKAPCEYFSAIAMDRDGKLWVGNTHGCIYTCSV